MSEKDPSLETSAESAGNPEPRCPCELLLRRPRARVRPALWAAGIVVLASLTSGLAPVTLGGVPADLAAVVNAGYASLADLAPGSQEAQAAQRDSVGRTGLPLEVKTAKTGIVFRLIPPGTFTMGSASDENGREYDETQHEVTLSKAFYCGKYEVTQGQWELVMGSNPSYFQDAGKEAPVEQVSWEDCQAFLKKLCQMEGVPEGTYRLLTEAEWEYACRAGTQASLYNGSLDRIAWHVGNSGQTTHAVGQKLCNAWGLYDMIGNVWEWCGDWDGQYPSGSVTNPLGLRGGPDRVLRGGSWYCGARYCRSANRNSDWPGYCGRLLGLRLARATPSFYPAQGPLQSPVAPGGVPADLVVVADAGYAPLSELAPGSQKAQAAQRDLVGRTGLPLEVKTAKTGIRFRLIAPGTFTMGSASDETGRDDDETEHEVTLSKAFYCGKYEVTQGQWELVMCSDPSDVKKAGKNTPVEQVSWEDCQAFMKKLCQMEGVPEGTYRLLSEAEWEYACRAGTEGSVYNSGSCHRIAWCGYFENRGYLTDPGGSRTHAVGQKLCNAWGLYDMIGNVTEWCDDWYGQYPLGSVTDPLGPRSGFARVFRGGDWDDATWDCRSADRRSHLPDDPWDALGLRLARGVPVGP